MCLDDLLTQRRSCFSPIDDPFETHLNLDGIPWWWWRWMWRRADESSPLEIDIFNGQPETIQQQQQQQLCQSVY